MSSLFGGGSGGNVKIPKAPDPVKSYQGFIDAYLKNQPTLQNAEDNTRAGEDPLRIKQQQQIQQDFGPKQYQQMVDAFKQLDPTYYANREQLGNQVSQNLTSGGPFAQQYKDLYGQGQNLYNQNQSLFPQAQNLYNESQGLFGKSQGLYNQSQNILGQNQDFANQLKGDVGLGYGLAPGQEAQIEQGLRGSQAARGNISGTGAGIAEGYALGDKGAQMYQQRLQNYEGGLGQLGSSLGGAGQALGASGQALNNSGSAFGLENSNVAGSGSLLNNAGSVLNAGAGYNQQQIGNSGSFLGLPNMGSLTAGVAPVSPDRSFSYINPNAGFQGVGLANQGYANQLGAAGLSQNTSGNPWMSAVGALGQGLGAYLGAGGSFSDERLKTDVKKIGYDKDKGLNLYEFAYKSPRKHVGYLAQEVQKTDPDAVWKDPASGYFKVSQEYAPLEVS